MTSIFINSLWGRSAHFLEAVNGIGYAPQVSSNVLA